MKSNLILKFLNENIIKINFMKNNLIKKLKISGYHERQSRENKKLDKCCMQKNMYESLKRK